MFFPHVYFLFCSLDPDSDPALLSFNHWHDMKGLSIAACYQTTGKTAEITVINTKINTKTKY